MGAAIRQAAKSALHFVIDSPFDGRSTTRSDGAIYAFRDLMEVSQCCFQTSNSVWFGH
jgi:hypothetical protein